MATYRIENNSVVRDLVVLQQAEQTPELRVHLCQRAQVVGIVFIHMIKLRHRRMWLVDRVEAEMRVERRLSFNLSREEGLKHVHNESRIVAWNLVRHVLQSGDASRIGRIRCEIISAWVALITLVPTTDNTLVPVWREVMATVRS